MTPDEVGVVAESFAGVKRKGTISHPGWYVRDRLVARLADAATLIVRVPLSERDELVGSAPATFGVPPKMEAHHKVEVYLDRADPDAVRTAIRLAWEMQRR